MIDDSSNRLVWVAVGIALVFVIYKGFSTFAPTLTSQVTNSISGVVSGIGNNLKTFVVKKRKKSGFVFSFFY